ncbi:MAG: hypothetical protein CMH48_09915 [Muricauda sp.]|nr:CHAT domain-containing protein [Allomuricauda sp.]MBC31150.1 hypothetical protein [Allomuricauda sp.]
MILYFSQKRAHLTILLLLSSLSAAFCQNSIQDHYAKELVRQGDSLFELWKLEKANMKYNKAKNIYNENKNWEKYCLTLNKLAESDMQADKYQEAFTKATTVLEVLESKRILGSLQENNAYYIIAYYHDFVEFDFESAMKYYHKALDIQTKHNEVVNSFLAKLYNGIAILHSKNGFYKRAVPFYEKALEISKKVNGEISSHVADIYGNMGFNYQVYGDFEKSIYYQKKSIAIDLKLNGEDNLDVAIAYSNISETYEYLLDLGKAIDYGEKALGIALSKFDEEHPFTAEVYQRLSSLYLKLDEPKKAEEYAQRSLFILEGMLGKHHPELIFPITTLGSVSDYLGHITEAIAYAERTLEICLRFYGENHVRTANAYSVLSNYISKNGDIEHSVNYQKKALGVFRKIYDSENHASMVHTYESMGDNYLKIGRYENALESYQKALSISRQIKPKNSVREGHLLNRIGEFHLARNDEKNASIFIDEGIALIKNDSTSHFADDAFLNQQLSIELYQNKLDILKRNSLGTTIQNQFNEIKTLHYKIDSIIDGIQYNTPHQGDRIAFSERLNQFYDKASLVYLTKTKESQKEVSNAFYFIEKGRFRVLKELLGQKKAMNYGDIPLKIRNFEDSLKRKQSYYKSKLVNIINDTTTVAATNKKNLFLTNRVYDSLLRVLEQEYPTYFGYNYISPIVKLSEISAVLRPSELLLHFTFVEQHLFLIAITKDNQVIHEIETAGLAEEISQQHSAIANRNTPLLKEVSYQLYKRLLKQALNETNISELTVVADGILWNLNFDVLLTEKTNSNNPKKLPFLFNRVPISFENSASSFYFNRLQETKNIEELLAFSFLGDANDVTGDQLELSTLRNSEIDLPGTREEIKEISKIFDGAYFYGGSALESAFKLNAGNYSFLHLALHGEVDDENPEDSKLYFTKSDDENEDGYLYAHEIFNLDLPAEMAVLSACNTGTGRLTSGEGIIGLGSAFQYAGTKSLVLSKWSVSDATTPTIMKYFYQNLKSGMIKSKALQQAKLKFLHEAIGEQAHPYYWSSFFVLGNNTAVHFKDGTNWYYYLLFIPLLVLPGYFSYRKFKAA